MPHPVFLVVLFPVNFKVYLIVLWEQILKKSGWVGVIVFWMSFECSFLKLKGIETCFTPGFWALVRELPFVCVCTSSVFRLVSEIMGFIWIFLSFGCEPQPGTEEPFLQPTCLHNFIYRFIETGSHCAASHGWNSLCGQGWPLPPRASVKDIWCHTWLFTLPFYWHLFLINNLICSNFLV